MELEIRRKILHIFSGLLIIGLLELGLLDAKKLLIVLSIGFIISIVLRKHRLPFFSFMIDSFDRKGESLPGKGALTFALGILILILALGKSPIVYASIMILTLGDAFSAIIGVRLKRTRHLMKTKHPLRRDKLLEGTFFGIVFASIGAVLFVSVIEAVVASIVAMSIESLEIRFLRHPIDDNILIPVFSALTMVIIRMV
jgi:dolichol kinase